MSRNELVNGLVPSRTLHVYQALKARAELVGCEIYLEVLLNIDDVARFPLIERDPVKITVRRKDHVIGIFGIIQSGSLQFSCSPYIVRNERNESWGLQMHTDALHVNDLVEFVVARFDEV